MTLNTFTRAIRYSALTLDVVAILFIGTFVIGHLFGSEDNMELVTTPEKIMMFFFPWCTLAGLFLALKKHFAGGLMVVLSIVAFHLVRHELRLSLIDVMALPGLLFIVWYVVTRLQTAGKTTPE